MDFPSSLNFLLLCLYHDDSERCTPGPDSASKTAPYVVPFPANTFLRYFRCLPERAKEAAESVFREQESLLPAL